MHRASVCQPECGLERRRSSSSYADVFGTLDVDDVVVHSKAEEGSDKKHARSEGKAGESFHIGPN